MPWRLLEKSTSQGDHRHGLDAHQTYDILQTGEGRLEVAPKVNDARTEQVLAQITIGEWTIYLKPSSVDVAIQPAHPRTIEKAVPPTEQYTLKSASNGEAPHLIFLRDGDSLFFPSIRTGLFLEWDRSEVQVNSSTTGVEQVRASEEKQEVSVSDEEDLDGESIEVDEIPHSHTLPSHGTPLPSVSYSEVVQETPTVNRISELAGADGKEVEKLQIFETVENTPPRVDTVMQEPFSTAQSKPTASDAAESDHAIKDAPILKLEPATSTDDEDTEDEIITTPRPPGSVLDTTEVLVKSRSKRSSPEDLETETGGTPSSSRASKRRRQDDSDSLRSMIVVDTTPMNRKGRPLKAQETATPTSSARSKGGEKKFEGSARVACSNSGIPDSENLVKFLRNHDGSLVEQVKSGGANVLCVRNGPLKKTLKLLKSIALGVPIVTDSWLVDSSQKGFLVELKDYVPEVPDQEYEWGFSMANIWSQPQSHLISEKMVCFTPAAKKAYSSNFREADELCKAIGGRTQTRAADAVKDGDDYIFIAAGDDDPDGIRLIEMGRKCYNRDLLTISILRGEVDLESDEFMIKPKTKGRRKRKS